MNAKRDSIKKQTEEREKAEREHERAEKKHDEEQRESRCIKQSLAQKQSDDE